MIGAVSQPGMSRWVRVIAVAIVAITANLIIAPWPSVAYSPIAKWASSQVSYGYGSFQDLNGVSAADAIAGIDRAASTWSSAFSSWKLQKQDANYPVAISSCFFPAFDCQPTRPGNEPAVTYPQYAGGVMSGASVVFNTGKDPNSGWTTVSWTTSCPAPAGIVDLETVALHELGHVVYLGDLYSGGRFNPPDSIMGWNAGSQGCKHDLGQDDLDGLHALYGYRYYISGVMNNWYNWTSTLTVMPEFGSASVRISFYGGSTYDPNTVYRTGAIPVGPTATPLNFSAASMGAPSGLYGATVDSDHPISVMHKSFNAASTIVIGTGP